MARDVEPVGDILKRDGQADNLEPPHDLPRDDLCLHARQGHADAAMDAGAVSQVPAQS